MSGNKIIYAMEVRLSYIDMDISRASELVMELRKSENVSARLYHDGDLERAERRLDDLKKWWDDAKEIMAIWRKAGGGV